MSIQQRIDEIIEQYKSVHHYTPAAGHPAIDRRLQRDIEGMRGDIHALLLAVQDEQNNLARKKCFVFAMEVMMMAEKGLIKTPSKLIDELSHIKDIEIPTTYNPKPETE